MVTRARAVLERVGLLHVGLVERPDEGQQDDPLGGPEVAAVDRREADAHHEQPPRLVPRSAMLEPGVHPGLDGRERRCQQEEHRHQPLEGLGREEQQQGRPDHATDRGDGAKAQQDGPPSDQLRR